MMPLGDRWRSLIRNHRRLKLQKPTRVGNHTSVRWPPCRFYPAALARSEIRWRPSWSPAVSPATSTSLMTSRSPSKTRPRLKKILRCQHGLIMEGAMEISLIRPEDFQSVAVMLADAFSDKHGRGCCTLMSSRSQAIKEQAHAFRTYQRQNPAKLGHIAIVRSAAGSIAGYCALQMPGDLSNCVVPASLRHKLRPGEVHLEQLAVSKPARGQGIGTQLLAWAHATARDSGAEFISLEVISVNRAKGLYEREGYTVTPNPQYYDHISWCVRCLVIWCCTGFRYTRADYMIKQMKD